MSKIFFHFGTKDFELSKSRFVDHSNLRSGGVSMSLSVKRHLCVFLAVFSVFSISYSATVQVKCSVKHNEQVLEFEDSAQSVEFDSKSIKLFGPARALIRGWQNLSDRKMEVECTVSPARERSVVIAHCSEEFDNWNIIKNQSLPIWQFVDPQPSPGYSSQQFVQMKAYRDLLGIGRVRTQFKISLNSSHAESILALKHHPENTAFSKFQKFELNYSGVNGLTELSPTQSCSVANESDFSGSN